MEKAIYRSSPSHAVGWSGINIKFDLKLIQLQLLQLGYFIAALIFQYNFEYTNIKKSGIGAWQH